MDLPEHLTANALVEVLNRLYGYEAYRRAVEALDREGQENPPNEI